MYLVLSWPQLCSYVSFQPRPQAYLGRGVRVWWFPHCQWLRSESSLRRKGRATGWILNLLLGHTDLAPHGEKPAPRAPGWGVWQQSHPEYDSVRAKEVPDRLSSLELCCPTETCGCGLAFPSCLGFLSQPQLRGTSP